MSDKNDTDQEHDPEIQPLLEFWSSYLDRANEAAKAVLEGSFSQVDDQHEQQESFETAGKSLDDYLRSPVFLQAMKQHIDTIIRAKRSASGSEPETTADASLHTIKNICELVEQIHGSERLILERLDQIERRLTSIETRRRN